MNVISTLQQRFPQANVRLAYESGIPVIQVIHQSPIAVPPRIGNQYVAYRSPQQVSPPEFEDYGPVNDLAQSWTPHGVTRRLWKALIEAGFSPQTHPVIHDLAAGHGRLVEGLAPFCRLVLNDYEPQVVNVLRQRFPKATISQADFRTLTKAQLGPVRCLVGSPPWIDDTRGYLPQHYIEKAEELLEPGGLAAFVLPDWFVPRTRLRHLRTIRPTEQERGNAAKQWSQQPIVSLFTSQGAR